MAQDRQHGGTFDEIGEKDSGRHQQRIERSMAKVTVSSVGKIVYRPEVTEVCGPEQGLQQALDLVGWSRAGGKRIRACREDAF